MNSAAPAITATIACLVPTLLYPGRAFGSHLTELEQSLRVAGMDADAAAIRAFAESPAALDSGALQDLYSGTFDLQPAAPLYAGHYIFGEDSFKRTMFLARLKGAFEEFGFAADEDLPDFIPSLVRFSLVLTDPNRLESLYDECLLPPLEAVHNILAPGGNPYDLIVGVWIHALERSRQQRTPGGSTAAGQGACHA